MPKHHGPLHHAYADLERVRFNLRTAAERLRLLPHPIPEDIMAQIDDELDELNTLAQGLPALIQASEASAVAAGTAQAVAEAQAITQGKVDTLRTTLTGVSNDLQPAETLPAGDANDSIPAADANDSIPAGGAV